MNNGELVWGDHEMGYQLQFIVTEEGGRKLLKPTGRIRCQHNGNVYNALTGQYESDRPDVQRTSGLFLCLTLALVLG